MVDTLIHMTAQYSNAVLLAVLPHVSDFAAKMELPVPRPITVNQVGRTHVASYTWKLQTGIWLTNGYWFLFDTHGGNPLSGFVAGYSTPTNFFREQEFNDDVWAKYFGVSRMTTNEAIALARAALLKAGFTPNVTHADQPPHRVDGPDEIERLHAHVPYCQVLWEWPGTGVPHAVKDHTSIRVQINTETKALV